MGKRTDVVGICIYWAFGGLWGMIRCNALVGTFGTIGTMEGMIPRMP